MSSWHSYPKVYGLGHAALAELLFDDVVVQEKIDGSQFSFGVFDGVLRVRSKGQELNLDAPEKMFAAAVDMVRTRTLDMTDGWTYRGEYLQKPKHNTLAYSRVPAGHIIIFDINPGEETYLSPAQVKEAAGFIGFETVPTLFEGRLESLDDLKILLELESCLGGTPIEGVVIKNYSRFGRDKKVLMGKYVSEAFKEKHSSEWKVTNPSNSDIVDLIGANMCHSGRWWKAVQHLSEEGKLLEDPKDIGNLIKAVQEDIKTEEQETIARELLKYAMPKILRRAVRGLPEWYKNELAQKQFESQP